MLTEMLADLEQDGGFTDTRIAAEQDQAALDDNRINIILSAIFCSFLDPFFLKKP